MRGIAAQLLVGLLAVASPLLGFDRLAAAQIEVCDGIDNDLDGMTDEELGSTWCGLGICYHEQFNCIAGQAQTCNPMQGAVLEVCNGLDDNCNGSTDELGTYECGIGLCHHSVPKCLNGLPQFCNPMQGAVAESCDLVDNDCDGETDEDLGSTACGLGTCVHQQANCVNGVTIPCDPLESSVPESCDALDNDCDGETDEDLGTSICGQGVCLQNLPMCTGGAPTPCNPTLGMSTELCNGLDDDCDGETDEGLGAYMCGFGECQRLMQRCEDGQYTECDPFSGSSPEECDLIDNDCDGDTDEGLGVVSCGIGVCHQERDHCVAGEWVDCDPTLGMKAETCNALDDDCDGETDEEMGDVSCGLGVCFHTVPKCVGGLLQYCNPYLGMQQETCDLIDNDCDGQTDNNMGSTTCGTGNCIHTVSNCQNGELQFCDPMEGAVEESCDAMDNDCDGQTDEGYGVVSCGLGACRVEISECVSGVPHECVPLPESEETCDLIDNDCDGLTDEDLGALTCGEGPCLHETPLCIDGVPQECDPLGTAQEEICDLIDNDCDGLTDEGLGTISCGKGVCQRVIHVCIDGVPRDCDPTLGASTEECDDLDNDCDGETDNGLGETTCGQGECTHTVLNCRYGAFQTCDPMEGATAEICDELDNDCDGLTDEEDVCVPPECPLGSVDPCDDEDECTYNDHCDGEGNCLGIVHPLCADVVEQDLVEDSVHQDLSPVEVAQETQETDPDWGSVEDMSSPDQEVVPQSPSSGGCNQGGSSLGPSPSALWSVVLLLLGLVWALRVGIRFGVREESLPSRKAEGALGPSSCEKPNPHR